MGLSPYYKKSRHLGEECHQTSKGSRFLSRTDYAPTEPSTLFSGFGSFLSQGWSSTGLEFSVFDNRRIGTL